MHVSDGLPPEFLRLRERYSKIYAVVSPPRCGSTAFSRVFWEQPRIRYYSHEPFETTYYRGRGLSDVVEKLRSPLDLRRVKRRCGSSSGNALLIKEMPYQVGKRFPLLAALAAQPLIFLVRDPRLNIASRIRKKLEVGDDPTFPLIETGWELLAEQVCSCRQRGIRFVVVDATDFRNHPSAVFKRVFARFGMEFSQEMLSWRPCPEVDLDNLGGAHSHLYQRVLQSEGLEPASEPLPRMRAFAEFTGLQRHVQTCLGVYEELLASPERIVGSEGDEGRF